MAASLRVPWMFPLSINYWLPFSRPSWEFPKPKFVNSEIEDYLRNKVYMMDSLVLILLFC